MILAQIPSKVKISPINELSVSRYICMSEGCAYSCLLEKSLNAESAPSLLMPPISYKNIIGIIFHNILQLVNKGQLECDEDAITEKWQALCKEHKDIICRQFPTLRNVSIGDYDAMYDAIDIANAMQSSATTRSTSNSNLFPLNEHYIKIENLLKGSIDRIHPSQGGYEILDYKTGQVYEDNGNIKKEYITQLNLYAYMLSEKEKVNVTNLFIVDKSGSEIPVPYYKDNKDLMFESVRLLREKINAEILAETPENLCRPTENNCSFCPCLHICKKRFQLPDNPFFIIEGTVTKIWNSDQLSLLDDSMNEIMVAKLGVLELDNIQEYLGKRLLFVNMLEIVENKQYNRCDKTVIYEKV